MSIIRVFPIYTNATPTDALSFVGDPPLPIFLPEVDEVRVSVAFSWNRWEGDRLAEAWAQFYPGMVRLGGPAYHGADNRPGEFVPGLYLKPGYTITSRGCTRSCCYCAVQQCEGPLRELPIRDGWNVMDNNLLACSPGHVAAVFEMLKRQPKPILFTGGLEASLITDRIAQQLLTLRLERLFLAYDLPEQWEQTRAAISLLRAAGLTRDHIHCYVLAAFDPDDTPDLAAARCEQVLLAGGIPFLMLYRAPDEFEFRRPDWREWLAVRRKYVLEAAMLPSGRRDELERAGGFR